VRIAAWLDFVAGLSMHRCYCAQPISSDSSVSLEGPEAHHLLHVLRATPGTLVTVFDGGGAEFLAKVENTGRRDVLLRIVERHEVDRELDFELAVGCALPKGDRQKFLVEKLVELGVTRLVPLEADRAVVHASDSVCGRLRRTVIEASKQCGRNRLLEVGPPASLVEFLDSFTHAAKTDIHWLAHPAGTPWSDDRLACRLADHHRTNVALAIGPEGGFSPDEILAADRSGWQTVFLGPRILRIETAAVALAAKFVLG
jgi:16S rRNA (uracil1498-N3)-methyltransferase